MHAFPLLADLPTSSRGSSAAERGGRFCEANSTGEVPLCRSLRAAFDGEAEREEAGRITRTSFASYSSRFFSL